MACQHEDCPICMEVFTGVSNMVVTECGHKFHTNCLMTSVAHNGFGCPYCRAKMAEEIEESDSEDEGDDNMSDDSDFQEISEREENRALGGVRWLFNRANNEEPAVYDGEDEDSDEEEEEDTEPKPSAAFIAKKLTDQGVSMEEMVKVLLLCHDEYDTLGEEFERVDNILFGKIRILISNFQPEQEPKVIKLEEVSEYYNDRFNTVV